MNKEIFLSRFEEIIKKKKLIENGQKVLVGVSGGVDSVALLIALWHMRTKLGIHLLAVHINHQLRGDESDQDEQFVKQLCFQFSIGLVVKRIELPEKGSLENNARELRFKCFNNLKKLYRIDRIALAHHKGDQAETVLFRMFRGSGMSGMKGILPHIGDIVHPFLDFTKEELTDFVKHSDLEWREDQSNHEINFSRNKIRNELIPYIENNFNQNIIDKLCQSATIFAETDEIVREIAQRNLVKIRSSKGEKLHRLSLTKLLKLKSVVRFYIYRQIFNELSGDENDFYSNHFSEIEKLYDAKGSKQINLSDDVIVLKEYSDLVFTKGEYLTEFQPEEPKVLSNFKTRFVFEDFRVILKRVKKLPSKVKLKEEKFTAYFDYDKIKFPLTFRHRQNGDRFVPSGVRYHKKLKDFFIDEKVSKFERDRIVIVDDADHLIWIAGYRQDGRKMYKNHSKSYLKIQIEPIEHRARSAERKKN
jgi:tRNA(Ile)-lysidine synthase